MKAGVRIDAVLVVLVGIGWGALAPATKALFASDAAHFDGVTVAVARAAWAFPLFVFALGAAWQLERPHMTPLRLAAFTGAGVAFGLGITLVFSIAAMHTSVAHISFLIGASPITNSAAAALAFKLPVGPRERLALALGVVGVGLLAAGQTGGSAGLFGDALMLLWLAAFAIYAVLIRWVGPAFSSTFTMSIVGAIAMAVVLLVAVPIPGAFRGVAHVIDTPGQAWWFFGEIVFGATLLAQTAYARAVRRFGVSIATIGAEYTALAVGILASLIAREPWSWLTVAGGALLACALGATFVGRRLPAPARM